MRAAERSGTAGKTGSQFTGSVFNYLTMPATDGITINHGDVLAGCATSGIAHRRPDPRGDRRAWARRRNPRVSHPSRSAPVTPVGAARRAPLAWCGTGLLHDTYRHLTRPHRLGPRSARARIQPSSRRNGNAMTRDTTTHAESYQAGLEMRRQVLGAAHVDRSLGNVSDFARPIQELVTEYCWGEIWTRQGLPPRTRSLLNLVMLTALNRSHELAVHVRGAINNGVTESEIQEALMQVWDLCRRAGRARILPRRREGAHRDATERRLPCLSTRTIAFAGLGNMGLPMVTRLLGRGISVHGFDVSPGTRALAGTGAHGHPTVRARRRWPAIVIISCRTRRSSAVVGELLGSARSAPVARRRRYELVLSAVDGGARRRLGEMTSSSSMRRSRGASRGPSMAL